MPIPSPKLLVVIASTVVVLGIVFYGGYRYGHQTGEVRETTATTTQTKVIDHTIIKSPDGTVTEIDHTETEHSQASTEISTPVIKPQPGWSLSVGTDVREPIKSYTVELGRRLIGDFWATGGYISKSNTAYAGLRYEW